MNRIERLPDDLVNKIAAGEVVERPASVVKELVENAIDAGATTIAVEIEAGGKALVRVRDDGSGMGREDAERALERHATSKLRALGDLQSIATHGFRGEALPSIASVSHLVLTTRDDSGPAGTAVEVRHGRLVHVKDAGHPRGTTVDVSDLFGGVPARRKFLRADATEAGHVAEILTQLALARPQTGFRLASGNRTILDAPPADSLATRLYQIYGGKLLGDLLPVDGGEAWARVRGFVSRPDRPTPPRASLRLFVNGRAVRDRALSKAVLEVYRAAGAGDRRPEAFLFLDVPLHMVDVNVHPAKTEVRFADARTVWTAVQRAVREALSAGVKREAPRAEASTTAPMSAVPTARRFSAERVAEAVETYLAEPAISPGKPAESLLPASTDTVLGQHRNTYIVSTDGEDLILVDQHTAHERVRFEALLGRLERRAPESQILLMPLVLALEPRLQPVVEAHAEALAEIGFDLEAFGGGSLRVRAVPSMLGARDPGRALEALLGDLLERESTEWAISGLRDRLAATLACHSAVRAGQPLGIESMTAIVRDLARTTHPTLCPHGRPTLVRLAKDDVSRWFGRTGWRRR
jgi:DNA mismatch repair protein MutL